MCSEECVFQVRSREMTAHFLNRGYKKTLVQKALDKAKAVPRCEALKYKTKQKLSRSPFIVTHNPCNPPLASWLFELQSSAILLDERMTKAMSEPPIVGKRNCKSLRGMLMPSKLPIERDPNPGCFKCMKKCILCSKYLIQTTHFQNTGENFKIRGRISCQSTNVIYLLFCAKQCPNSKYVGLTETSLYTRFGSHRSHILNQKVSCIHINKHFNSPNHSLNDMRCIGIEQVYSGDTKLLFFTENYFSL